MFLGIYPFLLGCPTWRVIGHRNLLGPSVCLWCHSTPDSKGLPGPTSPAGSPYHCPHDTHSGSRRDAQKPIKYIHCPWEAKGNGHSWTHPYPLRQGTSKCGPTTRLVWLVHWGLRPDASKHRESEFRHAYSTQSTWLVSNLCGRGVDQIGSY